MNPFKEKTLACAAITQNEKVCACGGKDKSNQPLPAYVKQQNSTGLRRREWPKAENHLTGPTDLLETSLNYWLLNQLKTEYW